MKILYLTKFIIDRHGFARSFHLAKGLVAQGHEVTFIAASPVMRSRCELRDGIHIVSFFDLMPASVKKSGLSPVDIFSRLWFVRNKTFDLIMVDSGFRPVTGLVGHLLAWWKRIPYVCEWWDWIGKGGLYERKSSLYQLTLGKFDHFFELWDKKHADGVVALSKILQQRAIDLGQSRERTCVIHGGCDNEDINPESNPNAAACWREKYGLAKDAVLLGFAGLDAQEVEDMLPFLRAMISLRHDFPSLYWFSTGGELDSSIRQDYNVRKEYIELGWVDYTEYSNALIAADILILTQEKHLINEARWPNKLGDYLASGNPVLATPVGEIIHFSEHNPKNGLVFVKWTEEAIIKALTDLIIDANQRKYLGKLNRQLSEGSASWVNKSIELNHFLLKVHAGFIETKRKEERG